MTLTALSSSAAAGEQKAANRTLTAPAQQLRVPAAATKQMRALATKAVNGIRKLQATGNGVVCLGTGASTAGTTGTSMQVCTITGSSAVCIEVSSDATANQTCNITQAANTSPRTNLAIALQVIAQRNGGPQGGTQTVNTTQQNTTKANLSFVAQILKQSLGQGANDADSEVSDEAAAEAPAQLQGALPNFAPVISKIQNTEPSTEGDDTSLAAARSGDVTQSQQSQQTANVCQTGGGPLDCHSPGTMVSSNLSSVYQSLRQRERAKNANTIAQEQNPEAGTCDTSDFGTKNMCAIVSQNTSQPGKNTSGLVELYRQFQSGFNTGSLIQRQDPVVNSNGLDHDINQQSPGLVTGTKRNTIVTVQLGRQVQRAKNADDVEQFQDPRTAKGPGSSQAGTTADTWFGRQLATQLQTNNGQFTGAGLGIQEQRSTYEGFTGGTFDVSITGVQNDQTASNSCSGSGSCNIGVECFGATVPEEGPPSPGFCEPISTGDFVTLLRH
ncbi:MAG: hypothetical protein ACXVII_44400 [Solirubrobacteraceae bacterium]